MANTDSLIENAIDSFFDEGKRTSVTRTTRKTKIKRATSQLASVEARKKNDSLYKQMKRYCDLCKKFRERVHKKYASRVRSRARR